MQYARIVIYIQSGTIWCTVFPIVHNNRREGGGGGEGDYLAEPIINLFCWVIPLVLWWQIPFLLDKNKEQYLIP
jgi:hypothetical protein